jgi:hypothetical protein
VPPSDFTLTATPFAGSGSTGESEQRQSSFKFTTVLEDEVKVQWDLLDQIAIDHVNRRGSLIPHVPNEQTVSLAYQAAQKLAHQAGRKRRLEPLRRERPWALA